MSGIRFRKRLAVIPRHLFLNVSYSKSSGWTFSWSISALGITRNLNRKRTTVDLPGGFYYREGGHDHG